MSKATHQGTCQCCGSTQKLPSGVLSLHGYTTQWGFFSGVCDGARNLPWELSKEWAERAIVNVQAHLESAKKALETPEALPKVVNVYEKQGRFGGKYINVIVKSVFKMEADRSIVINHVHKLNVYGQSVDEWLNEREKDAVRTQMAAIKSMENYIEWQTERCKNWKANPEALVALDAPKGPTLHLAAVRYRVNSTACAASTMGAQKLADAYKTDDVSKVTCKRCLKEIERQAK